MPTLLAIEVSDSSRSIDRGLRKRLYAEAGIAEYWVVDVVAEAVEVHTDPSGRDYRSIETHGHGAMLRPTLLPGMELAVDRFLG